MYVIILLLYSTIIYNNIDLSGSSKNIYIKSFLKYGMDLFIKVFH